VAELDENNNTLSHQAHCLETPDPTALKLFLPDLIVTKVNYGFPGTEPPDPNSPNSVKNIKVSFQIHNIGKSMSKSCKEQIIIPEAPEPNSIINDVPGLGRLQQEMYVSDDLVLDIKWDQTLKIFVDYENSINELREGNNTWIYQK
jgi:hypothetical protein